MSNSIDSRRMETLYGFYKMRLVLLDTSHLVSFSPGADGRYVFTLKGREATVSKTIYKEKRKNELCYNHFNEKKR